MATYFHGNQEIQGDGLQTLILMNPGGYNVGYSEPPQPSVPNFSFLNSPTGGGGGASTAATAITNNDNSLVVTTTSAGQQFVGIPLPIIAHAPSPSVNTPTHHGQIPRFPYHVYGSIEQGTPPREITRSQQGLSLTLSSQQIGGIRRQSVLSPTSGGGSPSSASAVSNGGGGGGGAVGNSVQTVLLGSKYLKATQELLEETVNVGKEIRTGKAVSLNSTGHGDGGNTSGKNSADLTTAERQEIQMKKAKLVHMLDEVEQRYRQYDHQMQLIISWFEQLAGIGSSKTYTSLALQTISKQFRSLKDTILTQIKSANKSLGEEEGDNEGSRLKFVDHQLRQQKALQQLGMIQPNAWRPQRGLPERSVSVLRAWLFEHFLHPYPKDSDKQILAKQTGLTRSQVSNWFINARVRLWKPMVEEMYLEEIKDHENTGSGGETKKTTNEEANNNGNNLHLIQNNSPPMEVSTQTLKKQRNNNQAMNEQFSIKFDTAQFGSYPINEIARFTSDQFAGAYPGNNNGVSLTLGLPHCENLSLSAAHNHHQGFVAIGDESEYGGLNSPTSSPVVYETVNLQNRKRFAAQLMHDFVA